MMAMDVKTSRSISGEFGATIELRGIHDVMRFADRMLDWQCEFHAEGAHILQRLREAMGAAAFDEYAGRMGLRDRTVAASKRPKAGV